MAGRAPNRALSSLPARRLRSGSLATSLTCMDKRTILALVLMALVIVVTPRLFPSRRPATQSGDSTKGASTSASAPAANATPAEQPAIAPIVEQPAVVPPPSGATPPLRVVDSATVVTPREQISVVSPGAVPVAVRLPGYRDLRPDRRDTTAVLAQPRGPLLHYRLAIGSDTISLDTIRFSIERSASSTTLTSRAPPISIS